MREMSKQQEHVFGCSVCNGWEAVCCLEMLTSYPRRRMDEYWRKHGDHLKANGFIHHVLLPGLIEVEPL